MALNEVDLELRCVQLCHCLLDIAPTERSKCLLQPNELALGDTERLLSFLAALFALYPMLNELPEAMNTSEAARFEAESGGFARPRGSRRSSTSSWTAWRCGKGFSRLGNELRSWRARRIARPWRTKRSKTDENAREGSKSSWIC